MPASSRFYLVTEGSELTTELDMRVERLTAGGADHSREFRIDDWRDLLKLLRGRHIRFLLRDPRKAYRCMSQPSRRCVGAWTPRCTVLPPQAMPVNACCASKTNLFA